MALQDLFTWRSQAAAATMPGIADDDIVADTDEPPDHRQAQHQSDFQKSTVRTQSSQKESLLTKALKTPDHPTSKPEVHVNTDLSRRRSVMSNASLASTAELTSDGLTSPSRTNTPSPPPPNTMFTSFAPFSLSTKSIHPPAPAVPPAANVQRKEPVVADRISVSPKSPSAAEVAPKKRCITFACGGRKEPVAKPEASPVPLPTPHEMPTKEAPKRACTIKFACTGPKPSDRSPSDEKSKTPPTSKGLEVPRKSNSRSPSATRKSPRPGLNPSRSHRDSTSTVRRPSQSPTAVRSRPRYITSDEKTLPLSEATRFHEFASEELQEDDWIRKDSETPGRRLTINDTLKMENDIRRLGNEAEEEALEDEQDEEDNQEGNDTEDENAFDEDEEVDSDDDIDGSGEGVSDGNETDNEAGFAESDDESDLDGEFAFWTPGRNTRTGHSRDPYRSAVHRSASTSSIDSLTHSIPTKAESGSRSRRPRPIKIRPATPDLPDSTDFVCGTLDEDRPLEEAYVSCMEARKNAKHKQTPQDIDPSFPTSDIEDEEDEEDIVEQVHDSDEHLWLHGKFEDSEDERHGRRRSASHRKSPGQSPKRLRSPPPPPRRLHSPPPAKTRLRSPPPRKLFGHSPKRMRSPPPARMIRSPPASLMAHASIGFAPLGARPGLTHTKSLPRTPNAFCRQYHVSRLIAANGSDNEDAVDGHIRGAIDIVKGLEHKRQRRKEKFYAKQNNRKGKGQTERRPQPGMGAERMRELGLLIAGKTGTHDPYMLSA